MLKGLIPTLRGFCAPKQASPSEPSHTCADMGCAMTGRLPPLSEDQRKHVRDYIRNANDIGRQLDAQASGATRAVIEEVVRHANTLGEADRQREKAMRSAADYNSGGRLFVDSLQMTAVPISLLKRLHENLGDRAAYLQATDPEYTELRSLMSEIARLVPRGFD